jgi:hypothetical protein
LNLRASRADWSKDVGLLKSELIKVANKRVKSCLKSGHHLEAIALLESLIADRLEAGLSRNKKGKQVMSTLGPLLNESLSSRLIGDDFCEEIRNWSRERNKVLHEMVKVRDLNSGTWRERMKHARYLAIEGLQIYEKLAREIKKVHRLDK